MEKDLQQQAIERFLNEYLLDIPEMFIVEIKISQGNNISVFADADNGITIERCTKMNRALYKFLEEQEIFANNDFSLEVSSPGVEEPLKLLRQYKKNIGRTVEVQQKEGMPIIGKLTGVNNEEISLHVKEGKGNKTISKEINILLNHITQTKVLVTF